jgi:hypothetical protein
VLLLSGVLAACAGGIRGGHFRKLLFARIRGPTYQQKGLVPWASRISESAPARVYISRVDVNSDVLAPTGAPSFLATAHVPRADKAVEDDLAREATNGGV